MIGAGTAHGVAPARRRAQPVPLRPPAAGAARAAAHAHVDGVRARRRAGARDRRARRRAATADHHVRRRGAVAMTRSGRPTRRRPPCHRDRLPGPDVVRAVALHRRRGDELPRLPDPPRRRRAATAPCDRDLFDPWIGPLSTRFAATFVLVAGVGVTLLTRRGDRRRRTRVATMRWTLVRARPRCSTPFGLAVRLDLAGARSCRTTARCSSSPPCCSRCGRGGSWSIGVGAALAGAGIAWWALRTSASTGTTRRGCLARPAGHRAGLLFDVFVNGTHPLLPWLAFFCAGIVLGRLLADDWWRPVAIGRRRHAVRRWPR